jgi:hypothetical protein
MSVEFQLCAEELAKLQPPVGKTLKRRERRGSAEYAERGFHWQQVVKDFALPSPLSYVGEGDARDAQKDS